MTLNEALAALDPKVEAHWTEQGLPKLDILKEMTGQSFSRKEITEAAPKLTRDSLLAGDVTTASTDPDADKSDDPTLKVEDKPVEDEVAAPAPLDELKARLEVAERAQARSERDMHEAVAEHARVTALVDKLRVDIDNATPKSAQQEEIMLYLKRSQEQRAARAEKMNTESDLDRRLRNRARPARAPL